jgi:arylsulfatase A-like enzyme
LAAKQPFYLYLSHYAVHAPFEPDRRFLPHYKDKKWNNHKKVYASMLESMDHSLGDILKTLDRLGVADNTIVVFMSDNGSPRNNPRNLPLRGHKITAYEGGSRVPLIVKWPGVTPSEQRTTYPVMIEDIFPTFLEMAGVKVPKEIDGQTFATALRKPDTKPSHRAFFWHYPNFYNQPPYSSIMLGDYKLIYWHTSQKIDLYNLKDDLGESKNIATQHPEKVTKLTKLLSDHLRASHADMATSRDSGDPVPWPDQVKN